MLRELSTSSCLDNCSLTNALFFSVPFLNILYLILIYLKKICPSTSNMIMYLEVYCIIFLLSFVIVAVGVLHS